MGDSKIIRQLRFHAGAHPQANQGEAPVRGYGSGHQAARTSSGRPPSAPPAIVPGAPDGPVSAPIAGAATARDRTSPNPHNGLTRRPGQINVTPGIGGDTVKVGRALAPSERALASMQTAPQMQPQTAQQPPGFHRPQRVAPVVIAQGFTRDQRDLLDALLEKCHDAHVGDDPNATPSGREQRARFVELVAETKAAIARLPVVEASADASSSAAELEDLEQPTQAAPSSRPARVASQPRGGTNPPGEVRIFAPNTQPFETRAGRQGSEHGAGDPPAAQ